MMGKPPPKQHGAQMLYSAAVEALSAGRFEDSIPLLEQVLRMVPPTGEIHNHLGTAYWKTGRLKQAEEQYARAIRLSPRNALALYNYSALLAGQSRLHEAEKFLRQAYDLRPDHPSIANQMGLLHGRHGDFGAAEKSFLAAIAAKPAWAEPHAHLGSVYRDTQRIALAEKSYRRALELNPAEEKNWLLLLQLQEIINRLEDAARTLEEAKSRFPHSPSVAVFGARLLRRQGKNGEALAMMERLAPDMQKNSWQAIPFLFELGQLYDLDDQVDKAFDCFQRANALQAATPEARTIDKKIYTVITDRLKRDYTAELARAIPVAPAGSAPAPIFLVGFPRSGTTLLDQVLSSHPGISVGEEKPAVSAMGEYFRRKYGASAEAREKPRSGADIWGDPCYPAALARLQPEDIIEMRRIFFREHGSAAGRLLVDKLPINIMHAGFIRAVFPDARFILALRHPCDCVLSCFMQAFSMNPAMARFLDLQDGARFYDEIFSVWEHTAKITPLNVHAVHYEDVVGNFRPTITSLLAFLGLPWDDAVLAYDKTARAKERINTPSYHQVTEKLYTRASGRWLRYREHMKPVLDILAPHAERYGYSVKTDK